MSASSANTYHLRLGRAVVGIAGTEPGFADFLARYFGRPSDPAAPAVTVTVSITEDAAPRRVPNSLLLTKTVSGGEVDIDDGLIRGHWDEAAGRGRFAVASTLLRGQMMRIFEQWTYQMFHSAARRLGYRATLVHAAGIARGGLGYLFVGPSGAGKSTVAGLSGLHSVLNDEMNLVEWTDDGAVLVGTPFNAFFTGKVDGSAPLSRILLLEQAPEHALAPAPAARAAADLAAQVAPPVGVGDPVRPATRAAMLDHALALLARAPAQVLRFRKDPGFWDILP